MAFSLSVCVLCIFARMHSHEICDTNRTISYELVESTESVAQLRPFPRSDMYVLYALYFFWLSPGLLLLTATVLVQPASRNVLLSGVVLSATVS